MENIVLPNGIKLGHAQNEHTGVTVILCEEGAVGGVDVRGGAPGTRETDLLRPSASASFVNAIVLTGGSAFGLESCDGVVKYLVEKKAGLPFSDFTVPLVAGAVLFDLKDNPPVYPDARMGYEAAASAVNSGFKMGSVGAGTGATVGKILGAGGCMKGGIGGASIMLKDAFVTAVVAVNALGDIVNHSNGEIIAGARLENGKFLNTVGAVTSGILFNQQSSNTTIGCIITNVELTKLQANRLAQIAHDGMALSIRPTHTGYDGDALFALSKGNVKFDFDMLCVAAVEATARAIENAVK